MFGRKKKNQSAPIRNVGLFTAAYLLVATIFALENGNWEFVFYIAVVIVLGGLTLWMHRHAKFPPSLLWALSMWGLLHMIGGLVPTPTGWPVNGDKFVFYSFWIYEPYLKYDHLVHAYGFGLATWGCWRMLLPTMDRKKKQHLGFLTLCVFAGMGLGAINEIVEFVAVLLIPNTNVGGYTNTGWDLVSNLTGCLIAALGIALKEKQQNA